MAAPRARGFAAARSPRQEEAGPLAGVPEMLELGLLVGRVRRRIRGRVQEELEARGKSLLSWAVLRHLSRAGPSTQRELAEAIAQHPAHVSRKLAALERERLLRRWRDPVDRRCLRVAITARGKTALSAGTPAVSAGIAHALSALAVPELLALRALLRRALSGDEPLPTRARDPRGTRRSGR